MWIILFPLPSGKSYIFVGASDGHSNWHGKIYNAALVNKSLKLHK